VNIRVRFVKIRVLSFRNGFAALLAILAIAITLTGCTIHPPGESDERSDATRLGKPYEHRTTQTLPPNPTLDQLVEFAEYSNADVEQAYWNWRSAIEQVPQDGTQTASLNLSAGSTFTRGHTSWGSSNAGLSNDPMTDIKLPNKLDAAARESLETARAAGRRFFKAKFELRSKVLTAYYQFALTAELANLESSNEQLLEGTARATAERNRAGTGGQLDVLKAANEVDLSRNDIANMQSQLITQRAQINALLSRPADAPLPVPTAMPPSRPIAYPDAQVIELAAQNNPELAALADEIHSRQDGIRVAKLQYLPDFNLSAGTDLLGITQSVLGQATVPFFRYEALNAAIAQAQANLHASEAARRQSTNDLAATVVSDLTTIKDADRQLALFQGTILPRARQAVDIGRSAYETGQATLLDLLDGERSLIAIQRLVATLKETREEHLADLESITTLDLSAPTQSLQ
jgi:outer membrane protein TolC